MIYKKLSKSKILVTGGAGFIGSNLVETFLKQDNEVACLDNFLTGNRENIQAFSSDRKFTLIEGDIRNLDTCRKACDGIDYVFHHAALCSVPRSIEDPKMSAEVNILGTLNMLVAACSSKVKRFIYAASSASYGDDDSPVKIETKIGRPISPYAVTKYVNELYAENFSKLYGIETIGLRYFNIFGRKQSPSGAYAAVIPKFINALIRHQNPVINGDGTYSRDFTYIDNVIQANELAALAPSSKLPTVFNIAYGQRTTLNDLFQILRVELSRYDSEIISIQPVHGPSRDGDIPHSLADISRARDLLGYLPKYDVREGLKETVKWYWENREKI